MLLENIANFDIGTQELSKLPFADELRTGRRFIYVCRRYSDCMGGDVHFLSERKDGSVLSRSYATGRLQMKHEKKEDEEILAQLLGMDESSEEFNQALIAAIDERLPSREELIAAMNCTQPAVDLTKQSSGRRLNELLGLARMVECDPNENAISSSAERIIAFDGDELIDIKTWQGSTNLEPLFKELASEFNF